MKNNFILFIGVGMLVVGLILLATAFIPSAETKTPENPDDNVITEQPEQTQEHDPVESPEPEPVTEPVESPEPEPEKPDEVNEPEQVTEPVEIPETEPEQEESVIKADKSSWNLILVNVDNYLPDGFTVETEKVQGNYPMDSRAASFARQMIADAEADGIELQLCSAYRALELQQRLFDNKVDEFLSLGYSREDAESETATIIAIPGTSEHQTGLALDIVTPSYQRLNAGYAETDAAKWLKANAANYGFILRYPKDKVDITKIMFEPWHYRYVGTEYSHFIMDNELCLEEFLESYGE